MDTDFTRLLGRLVAEKFGSQRDFVRRAAPAGNESSMSSALSKVLRGDLLPPLALIEAWADALSLAGEERARFLLLAYLEHTPNELKTLFNDQRSEIANLRCNLIEKDAKIAHLESQVIDLESKAIRIAAEISRLKEEKLLRPDGGEHGVGNTPVGGSQGPGGGRISRGKPPGGAGAPDHT